LSTLVLSPFVSVWLPFALCVGLIGLAGPELCRSGDVIAEKTGLSGSWIGLVLLASVTSLPELVIGATSVTIAGTPDIAIGDVFGSCVFNLLMLAVLDFLQRGESVYRRARLGHVVSAGFGVILIGIAGMGLLMHGRGITLNIGRVGSYTPVILLLYGLAMRVVFTYEREHRDEHAEEMTDRHPRMTLRRAALRYAVGAVVIVVTGTWLPFVAGRLAAVMGWQASFVGTLFVAGATSLPELVVTISAVRIGALDMAIANLLGSNLFDMAIVAIDDLLYAGGPILSRVSPIHAVSAMSATVMSGIVIVGLLYRPRVRIFRTVGWVSLGLLLIYLLNSYVLYLHGE
jgi:cation:H+ antiporter